MGVWLFSGQWALHMITGGTTTWLHTTQAMLLSMFQGNIIGSVCIDEYSLIPGQYLFSFPKI